MIRRPLAVLPLVLIGAACAATEPRDHGHVAGQWVHEQDGTTLFLQLTNYVDDPSSWTLWPPITGTGWLVTPAHPDTLRFDVGGLSAGDDVLTLTVGSYGDFTGERRRADRLTGYLRGVSRLGDTATGSPFAYTDSIPLTLERRCVC